MKLEEIKAYCLSKWKAYEDHPFGPIPICYKINGKVFAQIYPMPEDYKITLKCTEDAGQFYRQVYPGVVVRGYHCPPVQQPYWNTIYLDKISHDEILNMIDQAYSCVLKSFSKKKQKEIYLINEVEIRPIKQEEHIQLEDFLYDAIYQADAEELLPREVINQRELFVYIQDFGKKDDYCLVAVSEGMILGAVWARILAGEVKGYGNIDSQTPELAISIKSEFREQGIGSTLMKEIIVLLKEKGYQKVSLSVDRENYAYHMYQKLEFQVIKVQEQDSLLLLEL